MKAKNPQLSYKEIILCGMEIRGKIVFCCVCVLPVWLPANSFTNLLEFARHSLPLTLLRLFFVLVRFDVRSQSFCRCFCTPHDGAEKADWAKRTNREKRHDVAFVFRKRSTRGRKGRAIHLIEVIGVAQLTHFQPSPSQSAHSFLSQWTTSGL